MLISIAAILGGCATTSSGDFCDTARTIRASKDDRLSRETKRQIVAHNEFGEKACGWKP